MSSNLIVGIVPAAGQGSRLGKLPFSKELFPLTYKNGKTQLAADHLMGSMALAGVSQIHMVIREGKWDILAFYKSTFSNTPLCYHIAEYGYGVPFTVNQAYPFVKDHTVIFGFPDILYEPKDAFKKIVSQLYKDEETTVMLGSVSVSNPKKWDMINPGKDGFVQNILLKPDENSQLNHNWFIAAWKPGFTEFLNNFIAESLKNNSIVNEKGIEYQMGDVLNAAIDSGIKIKNIVFEKGKSLDIGTPEDLNNCTAFFNEEIENISTDRK